MKALTLHQPWASLVALGVKTIETRSWSTNYRGPLAIHAAKRVPTEIMVGEWESSDFGAAGWEARNPEGRGVDLPLGAIVATCRLVDVVPTERRATCIDVGDRGWGIQTIGSLLLVEPDQYTYGDYTPGRFAWLLDNIEPTTRRCPNCWGDGHVVETGHRFFPGFDGKSEVCIGWDEAGCGGDACPVCVRPDWEKMGRCEPVPIRGRQGLWEWNR